MDVLKLGLLEPQDPLAIWACSSRPGSRSASHDTHGRTRLVSQLYISRFGLTVNLTRCLEDTKCRHVFPSLDCVVYWHLSRAKYEPTESVTFMFLFLLCILSTLRLRGRRERYTLYSCRIRKMSDIHRGRLNRPQSCKRLSHAT